MKKRGYSTDFRAHGDTGKRYLLDGIPAGLWSAARTKARRDGVSMRALILQLITLWVAGAVTLPAAEAEPESTVSA